MNIPERRFATSRDGAGFAQRRNPKLRSQTKGQERAGALAGRRRRKTAARRRRLSLSLFVLFTLMTPAAGSNFSVACERALSGHSYLTHDDIPRVARRTNSIFFSNESTDANTGRTAAGPLFFEGGSGRSRAHGGRPKKPPRSRRG